MTVEQWRRVSAVFAAASDMAAPERAAYLAAACAGHPEDRAEIESLLAHHDDPAPPISVAPDLKASRVHDREALPSAPPVLPDPFAIGQQVHNYRILRRLKQGGMGLLYVAEDNLRREVVLKVLVPQWAGDERQRLRLRQEAEAMARLQHPGIAAVHAFEDHGDVSFLVSEFVRGQDLRERLEQAGPYDLPALLDLAIGVADALSAAHRAGIVHRDLKPENIMLPADGGMKLVDFGIARLEADDGSTRATVTRTGALVGTPAYMTPEQLLGSPVDQRCDVFALGVVLYEAATGVHPFAGRTRATTMINILQLEPGPLASRRPLAFGPLEAIVARCLRKSPEQRYQSAAALAAALRDARSIVGAGGLGGVLPEPSPDALWWWRFHQVAVSVFYGLLLIPLWIVRERLAAGLTRDALFFGALAIAVVSILLRLNAAFLARHSLATWATVRRRTRVAVFITDTLLAVLLLGASVLVMPAKPGLAALLLAGALGELVTLVAIEPVTERTVFPGAGQSPERR